MNTSTPSPSNSPPLQLPRDDEQSSLGWTAGHCWLSILNTAVCTYPCFKSLLTFLWCCFCLTLCFFWQWEVGSQLSDQGLNPHPLLWKVRSQSLGQQGKPSLCIAEHEMGERFQESFPGEISSHFPGRTWVKRRLVHGQKGRSVTPGSHRTGFPCRARFSPPGSALKRYVVILREHSTFSFNGCWEQQSQKCCCQLSKEASSKIKRALRNWLSNLLKEAVLGSSVIEKKDIWISLWEAVISAVLSTLCDPLK